MSQILVGYQADPWWVRLHQQIQVNNKLGADAATLSFIISSMLPADSDPYLTPRPVDDKNLPLSFIDVEQMPKRLPASDKSRLFYHVNRIINVHRLYIPPSVAPDILAIAHGEGHLGFSRCYEIISHSWYIRGLTKLFQAIIRHCPQYLALQTRWHAPYGSLQPIESPPVPFFTLTLDFVLILPLSKESYNTIMSVIYKFSKRVTFIEGANTWSAEQWAYAFLNGLDLINWSLPGELITNHDPKFLSKFWTTLFKKLGVRLLYSIAYHPQTNGFNKRINQTIEIALQFFVYAIEDPFCWPEVLPRI